MEFEQNEKGPCGKRAIWSLGKIGSLARWLLGEMRNGRKLNWAKRQKGRTDIGRNGKRAKLERAKKEWAKREKFGRNGNGRNGIGQTGNKPQKVTTRNNQNFIHKKHTL